MSGFTHALIERSTTLLFLLTLLVDTIGGLVEIVPLFRLETTIQPMNGTRKIASLARNRGGRPLLTSTCEINSGSSQLM